MRVLSNFIGMPDRTYIYNDIRARMEACGFVFEKKQLPYFQNKREEEYKYVHPTLERKFEKNGFSVKAKKFYLKPLTDEDDCEIGLVSGKTSPLISIPLFVSPNAVDPFDNTPAWVNREQDMALDVLLTNVAYYLDLTFSLPGELAEDSEYFEGSKTTIQVNKYERNHAARMECIKIYGSSCKVCGFNFQEVYGEIGRGFIHVHHIVPLSKIDKEYKIDFRKDLISVCPNCHAMLHKKQNGKEPSVQELKQMLEENRSI